MKKLMVLGASFPQAQLIRAAKEMGYRTAVCSIPGPYPGFDCADEIVYADISDPAAVLEAARRIGADGAATCCLDTGVRALGHVCDQLGLPGLSEAAAVCCADKLAMKKALTDAGVNTARFQQIRDAGELDRALEAMTLPVVVKAVDLQGSKGVYICPTAEEARSAFRDAMSLTRQDYCLVEEYIQGRELGAQAFVYQGRILFILPHGDITYMSRTAVPIGHYVPLDAPAALLDAAAAQSEKAIRALGLDNCAVNIDLIERDGTVYVIELTGRAGATCLAELVSIWYGVDYFKMIAAMAMGDDPEAIFAARSGKHTPNASRMLLSETDGSLQRIENGVAPDDESVYDLSFVVKEGDRIRHFTNAKDRLGQLIVTGESAEGCLAHIDELAARIRFQLAP